MFLRIALALIILINSFGVIAAPTSRRVAASAPVCETPGQLMSSNIGGRDFTNICRRLVDQDEGCKKLKPEKRMSCNARRENELLSSTDLLSKAGQCIKGFAWDSMVDLAKFVIDLIKMFVSAQINSYTAMYKFLTDSEYRERTMNAAGNAVHSGSRLASAFLNSAALYFAREFPRNLAKHPFNPMMALGETLFSPLIKFMTEAVQQIAAYYIPQYQCMNGTAKLYTICRVLGDFIMPPAIMFTFLKSGINGLRMLKRGAEAAKIARAERRFQEANELREALATARGAANPRVARDTREARITIDQTHPPRRTPRAERPRTSTTVTATPQAHPVHPHPAAPLAKPIEEHSADELIEVARSEAADSRPVAGARPAEAEVVLSAEEQAGKLLIDTQIEDLISGAKNTPELIIKYADDPEYKVLFEAEKQYPEQGRDIAIVISDMEKKNPQMKKSEIREEIERFLNTCELKR